VGKKGTSSKDRLQCICESARTGVGQKVGEAPADAPLVSQRYCVLLIGKGTTTIELRIKGLHTHT